MSRRPQKQGGTTPAAGSDPAAPFATLAPAEEEAFTPEAACAPDALAKDEDEALSTATAVGVPYLGGAAANWTY